MYIEYSPEEACLALAYFPMIGPRTFSKITDSWPIEKIFSHPRKTFSLLKGREKLIDNFIAWQKDFSLEKTKRDLRSQGINWSTRLSNDYPENLKNIIDPPICLFYQGSISATKNKKSLAIIGSRQPSFYGLKAVSYLINELENENLVIVSGLARGIDASAHTKAVDNGLTTAAVIGSGLDQKNFYPQENQSLKKKIIDSGGIVFSEYPPGTPALPQNFPRRNRLISGLSQIVLIIEAKHRSGSLSTANSALEQGRTVACLPGSIFSPLSEGTNRLLKSGAEVISNTDDLKELLDLEIPTNKETLKQKNNLIPFNNAEEKSIFHLIEAAEKIQEAADFDYLSRNSKLDTAKINSTLSILEIKSIISSDGRRYFTNNYESNNRRISN